MSVRPTDVRRAAPWANARELRRIRREVRTVRNRISVSIGQHEGSLNNHETREQIVYDVEKYLSVPVKRITINLVVISPELEDT